MSELSIPVATIVGAELSHDSIKTLSDSYREFCEDDEEYENSISPIEQDPEPYANGTKKTRPILKKYAQALLDKIILDQQLEAEAEAQRDVNLTPQQVKADMKIYVSICEKKIAKQQEQCDALQKQVDQLMDVVSFIATPTPGKMSLLARAMIMNLTSVETLLLNSSIIWNYHDIVFAMSTSSLEKLLILSAKRFINIDTCIMVNVTINCVGNVSRRPIISFKYEDGDTKSQYDLVEVISTLNEDVLTHLFNKLEPLQHQNRPSIYRYRLNPLKMACLKSSLEMVKFLHEKGATIGDTQYHVPTGPEGDLVAGYLQTHGSKPVTRF